MRYKMIFFLVVAISLSIVQAKEHDLVLLDSIDAGVTGIYLPDTVGYGDRVRPKAKIKNFGSAPAEIPARMKIGSSYNQVQNIILDPNCEDTLTFPLLAAFTQGWVMATCSTELFGDQNPGNDCLLDSICVRRFDYDIGIETIPVPDTIGLGQDFTAQAVIKNYGSTRFSNVLEIVCEIRDTNSVPIFVDTIACYLILVPDETDTVFFDIRPGPGFLSFEILFINDSNPSNNKKIKRIYRRLPAIEELQKPFVPTHIPKPTVMKIEQFKSYILKSKPEPKIFGIDGRRIKVERVRQGIYFIKTRTGDKKVVIIK